MSTLGLHFIQKFHVSIGKASVRIKHPALWCRKTHRHPLFADFSEYYVVSLSTFQYITPNDYYRQLLIGIVVYKSSFQFTEFDFNFFRKINLLAKGEPCCWLWNKEMI